MLTQRDIDQIKIVLKEESDSVRSEMRKGFKGIKNDLKDAVNFLDREHIGNRKRIDRIEEHLELPPMPGVFT